MSTVAARVQAPIEELQVAAYTVPTDAPEADGTLAWDSTTIVVVHVHGAGEWGLGYTYADVSTAMLVESKLRGIVHGRDAMDPQAAWEAMVRQTRNLGRPGITSMAIAAVDVAIWDLKARVLGLPLCKLLGMGHDRVPVYGSGGFTSYSVRRLSEQLADWVARGIPRVKMKVGSSPDDDPGRVKQPGRRSVQAPSCSSTPTVPTRASRRCRWPCASAATPVSAGSRSRCPPTTWRAYACCATARRPGWRLRRASTATTLLTSGGCSTPVGSTCCKRTSPAARGSPSCCGWTRCVAPGHADLAALRARDPSHPALALEQLVHVEYFHDHVRIEELLFDGVAQPREGALFPDLERAGIGLELKRGDAERYAS